MGRHARRPWNDKPITPGMIDVDDDVRVWLARAVVHELQTQDHLEELPPVVATELGVPAEIDDEHPAADALDGEEPRVTPVRRGHRDKRRLLIALVQQRLAQLEQVSSPGDDGACAPEQRGRLRRTARAIGLPLGLADDACEVLAYLAATSFHEAFDHLRHVSNASTQRERFATMAAALHLPTRTLRDLLGRRGPLQTRGLVTATRSHGSVDFEVANNLVTLFTEPEPAPAARPAGVDDAPRPDGVDEASPSSEATLLRLLSIGPGTSLTTTDFAHVRELSALQGVLDAALSTRTGGVHVLLHGPPGTGKTELARLLSSLCGARLGEIPLTDDDGFALDPPQRVAALRLLDSIAAVMPARVCLLVDEASDVLPSRHTSLMGGVLDESVSEKGYFNELLEKTRVPVLWTSNHAGALDPAHLRRFALVVEVVPPPRAQRLVVASRVLHDTTLPASFASELADDDRVPVALVQTVARTTKMLAQAAASDDDTAPSSSPSPSSTWSSSSSPSSGPDALAVARIVVDGHLRLAARAPSPVPRKSAIPFQPSWLNATPDLSRVVPTLRSHPQATILLGGPPGTGKSAWARHLADELQRPLLVRTPAELLSKWVGDSEKQLAAAFAQARRDGAVLLLDEADTFLFPRGQAQHSWEISQTNQMLVLVESFPGILVCTTNAIERLDPAILRRFDLKVTLQPLTSSQRVAMLHALCTALSLPPPAPDDEARVQRLAALCPGDVVAVERRLRFTPPHDVGAVCTALEQEHAGKGAARAIGFAS